MSQPQTVIIGGGFFGCSLGIFLRERGEDVIVLERAAETCTRASFVNQARVHNGYHYPRSFLTAVRSAVNFPRFCSDFSGCVDSSFDKIYAIARNHSKITGVQFVQFCRNIGAEVHLAPQRIQDVFDPAFIEAVYIVKEYAFNAQTLRETLLKRMRDCGVRVLTTTEVASVAEHDGELMVTTSRKEQFMASWVYNCTYANVNTLLRDSGLAPLPLKQELAEIALITPPKVARGLGVTVMDGPFFSTMPFPALSLHSLTHVRYTPRETWLDEESPRHPYQYLERFQPDSLYRYMIRDAQRYMPCLSGARYEKSLFEVKTVLRRNESDDGRPILFERHRFKEGRESNFITVLGGKIDNVYDILERVGHFRTQPVLPDAIGATR